MYGQNVGYFKVKGELKAAVEMFTSVVKNNQDLEELKY